MRRVFIAAVAAVAVALVAAVSPLAAADNRIVLSISTKKAKEVSKPSKSVKRVVVAPVQPQQVLVDPRKGVVVTSSGTNSQGDSSKNFTSSTSGLNPHSGTYVINPIVQKSRLTSTKNHIIASKQCRIGAFSMNGAAVIYWGDYDYFHTAELPVELQRIVRDYYNSRFKVRDITLTDGGNYAILYGDNGYNVKCAYDDFKLKLKAYNNLKEIISSMSFNDRGDWAIIGKNYYSYSSSRVGDFIEQGRQLYGDIYSIAFSDIGMIACFERGIYYENIPLNLQQKLSNLSFKARFIKFSDEGFYLITDGITEYAYFM
ncbi:MAG: hypothetical protein SNH63_06165 [Rikenellaceae bacterium]